MKQVHLRALSSALVLFGALLCAPGCATGKAELSKSIDKFGKEINELRASNAALRDRVEALEEASSDATTTTVVSEGATGGRPQLEVVRLLPQPEPAPLPEPVVDDGPRPVLHGNGNKSHVETVAEAAAKESKRTRRKHHTQAKRAARTTRSSKKQGLNRP